jgi:DNA-directed RNA polymerase specialized sigma24 family protein
MLLPPILLRQPGGGPRRLAELRETGYGNSMSVNEEECPAADHFPPTMWTVLLSARDPAAPEAAAARESLCRAYWRPVHSWLRALGVQREEAEDLTQRLLADFCRSDIARVDPSKGRLRHFFKAAARHLLYSWRRDAAAQKRGGGVSPLPLDEMHDGALPADEPPADAVFDRQWAWTIFDRAMKSLEASYAGRGKAELLAALRPALISADSLQRFSEIGAQFNVKESQIRLELHRLRRRLAERLHSEVAATLRPTATAEETAEETRYLLTVLAHEPAR